MLIVTLRSKRRTRVRFSFFPFFGLCNFLSSPWSSALQFLNQVPILVWERDFLPAFLCLIAANFQWISWRLVFISSIWFGFCTIDYIAVCLVGFVCEFILLLWYCVLFSILLKLAHLKCAIYYHSHHYATSHSGIWIGVSKA